MLAFLKNTNIDKTSCHQSSRSCSIYLALTVNHLGCRLIQTKFLTHIRDHTTNGVRNISFYHNSAHGVISASTCAGIEPNYVLQFEASIIDLMIFICCKSCFWKRCWLPFVDLLNSKCDIFCVIFFSWYTLLPRMMNVATATVAANLEMAGHL